MWKEVTPSLILLLYIPSPPDVSIRLIKEALSFFAQPIRKDPKSGGVLAPPRAPCVLTYATETEMEGLNDLCDSDSESIYHRLGFSLLKLRTLPHTGLLVAAHCSHRSMTQVLQLFPLEVAEEIFDNSGAIRVPPTPTPTPNVGVEGSNLDKSQTAMKVTAPVNVDTRGAEVQVIEKVIPPELLTLLESRLEQIPSGYTGSTSFFIPFDKERRQQPRSLIEYVIMKVLAPTLLGPLEQAVQDHGFTGAEWWIQSRAGDNPKEFHLDTAITWCRDHDWPTELLGSCHYYPAIGTVVYLGDYGGATAVFNQSMGQNGTTPTLPREVALVYPRRNRVLAFNGKLYHGVMEFPAATGRERKRATLLVNYWRNKTAGELFTPTVKTDTLLMQRAAKILDGSECRSHQRVPPRIKYPERQTFEGVDFYEDFKAWREQRVPARVNERLNKLIADEGTSPFFWFHYGSQKSNDILEEGGQGYARWTDWTIEEDGTVSPLKIDAQALNAWRAGMPGGNPFALD